MIGIKSNVIITENERPKIIDKASGVQKSAVKSRGTIPMTVVTVVRRIGLNLDAEPSRTVVIISSLVFSRRRLFITSSKMIELLTTIPIRAMSPIKAGKDNALPVNVKPSAIP